MTGRIKNEAAFTMTPQSSDTLYEQIVKELKNRILSGVYKKGDPLPSEKELIDSMGVSRITIRKAISILADAGLIATSQGKKSIVIFDTASLQDNSDLSSFASEYVTSFRQVEQIRLMIEPAVAREVAETATDKDIARLEAALKGPAAAKKAGISSDFHRALIEILKNDELLRIYDNLIVMEEGNAPAGIISPEKQADISSVLEEQHRRILGAIKAHDGEFAYFFMKDHTRFINNMYERHFKYLF